MTILPVWFRCKALGDSTRFREEGSQCHRKFNTENKGKALSAALAKRLDVLKIKSYIYIREWFNPPLNYPEIGEDN